MWRTFAIACGVMSCLVTVPAGSSAAPTIRAWAGTERFAIERAV